MKLIGADVVELNKLANSLKLQADQLSPTVDIISRQLDTTSWTGRDMDEFEEAWISHLRPALLAASEALHSAGDRAGANAAAQEKTSSDSGGGSDSAATHHAAHAPGAPAEASAEPAPPATPALAMSFDNVSHGLHGDVDQPDWPFGDEPPGNLSSDGPLGPFPGDGPPETYATPADEAVALAAGFNDGTVDREAILTFISTHSDDSATLGVLFSGLGGRATLYLIQPLNDSENAARIRNALARGSATWDDATARQFADGLLAKSNGMAFPPDYNYAIQYLFSGPVPLSGPLAAASAALLEDIDNLHNGTFGSLRPIDLSTAVLLILAQDPVAATAYFSDPEHGVDRRLQWFQNTDWSDNEFAVPAALLNATQLTSDGDPISTHGTPEEQRAAAVLFSQLTRDLTRNPDFTQKNVGDEASRHLGQAIGVNWAAIQEGWQTTAHKDATTRTDGETYVMSVEYLSGEQAYAPVVPREHFEWLLGMAGSTDSGAAVLDGTMTAYRAQLLDYGLNGEVDPNTSTNQITSRLVRAQEMMSRSVNTQALDSALHSDQQARNNITGALLVVGVALAPFTGGGSTLLGQAGAFAANSIVTTSVNESLGGWLATSSTAAEARLGTDTARQDQLTRMTTVAVVAEIVGHQVDPLPDPDDYPPPPPPEVEYYRNGLGYLIPITPKPQDTAAPYADAVEEWNAANYERVLEAAENAGVSREELDSLISDYDSTPYITGKKPS